MHLDQVSKIKNPDGTAPAEISVSGYIDHDALNEAVPVRVIIDHGAGRSYLLLHDKSEFPFISKNEERLTVQFANDSSHEIREAASVDLKLESQMGDETFTRQRVKLFVIRSNESQHEINVLLGRDLIQQFKLDVFRATKAAIGNTVLFDGRAGTQRAFLQKDRVQFISALVTPSRLEGMPKCILGDLTADPEGELSKEEALELFSEIEPHKLQVEVGAAETTAEFGRLYIKVPWRNDSRPSRNFMETWARDQASIRKLSEQEKSLYRESVKTLINDGFAVKLNEAKSPDKHYIACRPVFKFDRSSTKCRLCLDARTLNHFTHQGETLGEPIHICLLRFRKGRYVAIYDLDKAFWQIKLEPTDCGWFNTVIQSTGIQFQRMIFGANFSPSGLEHAIKLLMELAEDRITGQQERWHDEPTRPADIGGIHHYVDDFCHTSDESPQRLHQQSEWLRWFLQKYGFPSSKFITNTESTERSQSYLGYQWVLPADIIKLKMPHFEKPLSSSSSSEMTVRQIVQTISQLYDPLGILLKQQLEGRSIIRRAFGIASSNCPWKERISDEEIRKDLEIWKGKVLDQDETAPRLVQTECLNIFSDASQAFWAYEIRDRNMQLVCARGGITSEKSTIPRNELSALREAVVDAVKLVGILKPERITFYADSLCTIHRLYQRTKMPGYEQRRVNEIVNALDNLNIDWAVVHLPGDLNPADYPTRPALPGSRPTIQSQLIHGYRVHPMVTRFTSTDQDAVKESHDHVKLMVLRKHKSRENLTTQDEASPQPTDTEETEPDPESTERKIDSIKNAQARSGMEMNEFMTYDQWGIIRKNDRIVIPDSEHDLIESIIKRIHAKGHFGISATVNAVTEHYTWKNMRKDIKTHVLNCETCQTARTYRTIRTVAGDALKIEDIEQIPLGSIIGIDVMVVEGIVEGFPSCILTATCMLSKWIRAEAMETQTSEDIVTALTKMCYNSFFPLVIVMDNAPAFRSKNMKRFAVRHGIRLCHLPPHASAYGGWIERSHQSVLNGLRTLVITDPTKRWNEHLSQACYLANSRPYDKESLMSPITLIYSAREPDPEEMPAQTDELLQQAQMLHLSTPISDTMKKYEDKQKAKRSRQLKQYEHLFNKKRDGVRRKLHARLTDQTHALEVDTLVRVFRPVASKVKARWSEPRRIVDAPSGATRVVEQTNGNRSLEWVANLIPVHVADRGHYDTAIATSDPSVVRAGAPGLFRDRNHRKFPKEMIEPKNQKLRIFRVRSQLFRKMVSESVVWTTCAGPLPSVCCLERVTRNHPLQWTFQRKVL